MMMIERVTGWEFLKDHEITDFKPQNPTTPTISMDVPSTSVAPHTAHSGSAAPPSGCSRVCLLGDVTPFRAKTCS
jgi:hypothetical protein